MGSSFYYLSLVVQGGRGGEGLVSFNHSPRKVKGGPDGGNGGSGGDVFIRADEECNTLEHLHSKHYLKASRGASGGRNKRHGKKGKDLVVSVPIGTNIYTKEKKQIGDLIKKGEEIKIVQGGEGGRGNINFVTSTNQAPRIATSGKAGEKRMIELEYSPLVDISVIGPPNTGKSSLIAHITSCKVKVRDYPFTTKRTHPWTYVNDYKSLTFLDTPPTVPENLEDIKILSKRAKILLVVLDGSRDDPWKGFEPIFRELEEVFSKDPEKSIVIVINKIDRGKGPELKTVEYPVFPISVKMDKGINLLKAFIFKEF